MIKIITNASKRTNKVV